MRKLQRNRLKVGKTLQQGIRMEYLERKLQTLSANAHPFVSQMSQKEIQCEHLDTGKRHDDKIPSQLIKSDHTSFRCSEPSMYHNAQENIQMQ